MEILKGRQDPFFWKILGSLLFIWLAFVFILSAGWGLPVIDDWVYAYSVKNGIKEGVIGGPIVSNSLALPQILFGILLTEITGGFQYNFLHGIGSGCLLTITFVTFLFVHRTGQSALRAGFVAFAIITCPIVLHLGQSFMTDLPFLALFAGALFFFSRSSSFQDLTIFLVLASLAFLTREFGIILFPMAILVLSSQAGKKKWNQILTVFLTGTFLFFTTRWIQGEAIAQGMPYASNLSVALERITTDPFSWLKTAFKRIGGAALYIGLFSIPLLPALVQPVQWKEKWHWTASIILAVTGTFFLLPEEPFSPFRGNLFYFLGLGPMTLPDVFSNHIIEPVIQQSLWIPLLIFISLLAVISAGIKLIRKPAYFSSRAGMMLFGTACLYIVALFFPGTFFDRYLLPVWWILLVSLSSDLNLTGWRKPTTVLLTGLVAVFSVFGVMDYQQWQKARWHLFERSVARGIDPESIDGGYEVNGWTNEHLPGLKKEAFEVHNPGWRPYMIAFSPIRNTMTIDNEPCRKCMFLTSDSVFLLKRLPVNDGGDEF